MSVGRHNTLSGGGGGGGGSVFKANAVNEEDPEREEE
jgi:hypothetical protein